MQDATTVFEHWDDCVGCDAGFVQRGFLRITRDLDASTLVGDLDLMKKLDVPVEIVPAEDLDRFAPTGEFACDEVGVLMPRGGLRRSDLDDEVAVRGRETTRCRDRRRVLVRLWLER